jgi:hypothetical protein
VNAIQSEDWRASIVATIKGYYESEDGVVDKRVAIRARNYHIIDDNLYRKGVCAPLLKCISATEASNCSMRYTAACAHTTLARELRCRRLPTRGSTGFRQ